MKTYFQIAKKRVELGTMHFSDRFLNIVQHELSVLDSLGGLENVVIYFAQAQQGKPPTLKIIGEMPGNSTKALTPIENDPDLRLPSPDRRWYPLQDGSKLLGVIRVERFASDKEWSEELDQKLQSCSLLLANSLGLELERSIISEQYSQQKEQIQVLIHQLRNPLTALKTYAQLLMRKLGPDNSERDLIEGLLSEQDQVNKYLLALDKLSKPKDISQPIIPSRLLLPPLLPYTKKLELMETLKPLIDRSAATAKLQDRKWLGPIDLPAWLKTESNLSNQAIGEIVANLLENAFKYSPSGSSIGLCFNSSGLCVWDSGEPIDNTLKEKIFLDGFRASSVSNIQGSGIGLTLARELAEQLGGNLSLISTPNTFDKTLPANGNAFVLKLPVASMQEKIT